MAEGSVNGAPTEEAAPPKGRRTWRALLNGLSRRQATLLAAFAAASLLILVFVPPVYKLKFGSVVVTRYDRRFGATKAVVGPSQKGWISTAKISRHALNAIIAEEDGRFYEHHGLDFEQVRKSYLINLQKGRYARGASTISQQVVKMAFLTRDKTLVRKVREAMGALIMEMLLPKDQILEWYINMAEFGDGVYGIEEGCWHYFKTKPELLTIAQSVHLALVLPSPNNWSRGLRRRSLTPFGQRRFLAILKTMRGMGYVTKAQWREAVTTGDFGRPLHGYGALLDAPVEVPAPVVEPADALDDEAPSDAQGELPEPSVTAPAAHDAPADAPLSDSDLPLSQEPLPAVTGDEVLP